MLHVVTQSFELCRHTFAGHTTYCSTANTATTAVMLAVTVTAIPPILLLLTLRFNCTTTVTGMLLLLMLRSNCITTTATAGTVTAGTRLMGGKDAASARYIFTKLERIARAVFHPDDDAVLTYLDDDGMSIEPAFFVPVLPMVLVNGVEGIGTGWSTSVLNYR
jgi:DNA gyrase/topoisomerase IV, subunit A